MIIDDLLTAAQNVLQGLESGETVRGVLKTHERDIMDLQRLQLLQGRTSSGADFRPYYTEDLKPGGYFNSVESAKRYADWKQTLNYPQQAERNPNAPNLYITGKFHSEIDVDFGNEALTIGGDTMYAKGIVAKYGRANFGLTAENWNKIFYERGAYNQLINAISAQLTI